ncbi:hypothetical protein FQA39_LY17169 [Lamprigera yunnana]|nr:hypothetical protein FQA39_LY17169 [Lamprigera yunnana]
MKSLVLFSIVCAIVVARPGNEQFVSVSQDTLGNYHLKYVIEGISRVEDGNANGNVIGGYSYIDPQGVLRKTEFTSGVNGFQATGSDIPVPIQDTPDVAVAKSEHLALLRAAEAKEVVPIAVAPTPVFFTPIPISNVVQLGAIPDTPEVIAARTEHFAALEAARKETIVA